MPKQKLGRGPTQNQALQIQKSSSARDEEKGVRGGGSCWKLLETSSRNTNICQIYRMERRRQKERKEEKGKEEKPRSDAMDSEESEMMDTETATSGINHNDAVKDLLTLARQLINQGKPSQALQAVVMAMRTRGGDEAIFQSLHRARELYRNRLQANAAADQLACLFAECAIAEVQSSNSEPSPHDVVSPTIAPDSNETSILAETGRKQIVLDAFSDGSSFICLQCGGLVSNHRKDEHYAYWCCKI